MMMSCRTPASGLSSVTVTAEDALALSCDGENVVFFATIVNDCCAGGGGGGGTGVFVAAGGGAGADGVLAGPDDVGVAAASGVSVAAVCTVADTAVRVTRAVALAAGVAVSSSEPSLPPHATMRIESASVSGRAYRSIFMCMAL
jgi:hypothetical protein